MVRKSKRTLAVTAQREDIVAVVEAAYAGAPDHATWAGRVIEAVRPIFGGRDIIGIAGVRHSADCVVVDPMLQGGVLVPARSSSSLVGLGVDAIKALYYPPAVVISHTELEPLVDERLRALVGSTREALGVEDCLGLLLHPAPNIAVGMYVGYEDRVRFERYERQRLTQLALHIEAGLRIRLHPESIVAILATDGTIAHREGGAFDATAMKNHVKNIERARTRSRRKDASSLELWPALTSGELSIVERWEASRRYYALVENPPSRVPARALTRGEIDVLSHAARGLPSKLVAYALGISTPRVSSLLASAAAKLGASSRVELVRIGALLTRDPRATVDDDALTAAERDVLTLVARGLSNAEIARMRNRSIRTIANQVAQLLRKTGSATRRGLVAQAVRTSA